MNTAPLPVYSSLPWAENLPIYKGGPVPYRVSYAHPGTVLRTKLIVWGHGLEEVLQRTKTAVTAELPLATAFSIESPQVEA